MKQAGQLGDSRVCTKFLAIVFFPWILKSCDKKDLWEADFG